MSAGVSGAGRRAVGPTALVLGALALAVAYGSGLPTGVGLAVALGGVGAGVVLRVVPVAAARSSFPVPPLLALGLLSLSTPVGPLPILLVGLSGVAFVAWLLEDPFRPSAGAARGAGVWALPALGVGLAWASSYVLPPSSASLGVAGGLAAAALVALAVLVSRPVLFDRDATQSV